MSTRLLGIIILVAGLTVTPTGTEMIVKALGQTALSYYSITGWVIAACGAAAIFLSPRRATAPQAAAPAQPPPRSFAVPQSFSPPVQSYSTPGPAAGERRCSSCAKIIPPGKNFCTGCGTRLG